MKERDKFLTEAMEECCHDATNLARFCKKCFAYGVDNNDFSTWTGFGKLWEWAQNQEWWPEFWHTRPWSIPEKTVHPDRFADAIYEFLKERHDV